MHKIGVSLKDGVNRHKGDNRELECLQWPVTPKHAHVEKILQIEKKKKRKREIKK